MTAPKIIADLVTRFRENEEAYRRDYGETETRREFLDPLFKALGWDIDNAAGNAEAYKDVVHEDSVKVGFSTKAPDYSFRVGGVRKFFLEAKKPAVHIKEDSDPSYQLRRYAWSAKLPLSIVSNFAEFAVYDCRGRPSQTDKPSVARLMYFTCADYEKHWDDIASVFSKDALYKGSFDKYAAGKGKKGSAEVDDAFLEEIETWRDALARNIALRNSGLTPPELNFAVQQTIDRIIFLRICEDRGIEMYGRLLQLQNGENTYARLKQIYQDADDRYNSGLFHFRAEKGRGDPDALTLSLKIDDKTFKDILRHLYYPESPYEFSVLPADILGQVYEQFLGKVIRLTAGGHAKVEDKPEVKKAGGVYYTPTYIVDYIITQTVGKLLESSTPDKAAKLRILDPACGSGSFLIRAYQHLLDWHRNWYAANDPEKHAKGRNPKVYRAFGGIWRLSTAERKRILLNNIYGVDIDPQAVEVTKLSLLLKVLEDESSETLGRNQEMFHERALPDLDKNIKCGNSLIGSDFFSGRLALDNEEHARINAFDWNSEFAPITKAGGFDTVIGNPPYIRIQVMKEWAPLEVEHYRERYLSAGKGNYDLYVVFVEKGLSLLAKNGRLGFILPHKFFNAHYGEPLRQIIAKEKHLAHIVHFGDQQVFPGATTYTCLMFLDKASSKNCRFSQVADLARWRADGEAITQEIPASKFGASEWNINSATDAPIFAALSAKGVPLGSVAHIFVGLQTSADKIYVLKKLPGKKSGLQVVLDTEGREWKLESELLKPFLSHVSIASYERPTPEHCLIFPYRIEGARATLLKPDELSKRFPNSWRYLRHCEERLRKRESAKADGPEWYGYIYRKNLTAFEDPKLVVQVISKEGRYAFDDTGVYFSGGGNGPYYGIRWSNPSDRHSLYYLQALLNSNLLDQFLHSVSSPFRGGYWSYGKRFIEQIPIRLINFDDKADRAQHNRIVTLVQQLLKVQRERGAAKAPHERIALDRQTSMTNKEIESAVCELYGLPDARIAREEKET